MDILISLCTLLGISWVAIGLRLTLIIFYTFAWFLPLFALVFLIFFFSLYPVIEYFFGEIGLYYLYIYAASAIVSFLFGFLYLLKKFSIINKPYFFIDKHFGHWWLKK